MWFACNKAYKNKFLKALKYTVKDYPKGESKKYILGEYIKPIILKQGKALIVTK